MKGKLLEQGKANHRIGTTSSCLYLSAFLLHSIPILFVFCNLGSGHGTLFPSLRALAWLRNQAVIYIDKEMVDCISLVRMLFCWIY